MSCFAYTIPVRLLNMLIYGAPQSTINICSCSIEHLKFKQLDSSATESSKGNFFTKLKHVVNDTESKMVLPMVHW